MRYYCVEFEKNAVRIIQETLNHVASGNKTKFILYPFGLQGKISKAILNSYFGIQEYKVVDNFLSEKYENIFSLDSLTDHDLKDAIVFMTSNHIDIYDEIRDALYRKVDEKNAWN